MGLFDLFKRSRKSPAEVLDAPVMRSLPAPPPAQAEPVPPPPQPPTAVELRIMLFDAIATRDEEKLAELCRDHHDFLVEYADTWSIVPEALHNNPAAARWYGEGFHAIAHFCADKLDRRELLERLAGTVSADQSNDGQPPATIGSVLDAHAA